jgi:hypothetical protein
MVNIILVRGMFPRPTVMGVFQMKTKPPLLTKISYSTAIALACFSGGVATYGLTKFAPGAEWIVAAMGVLFEAGKLTSFAMVHRPLPTLIKGALLAVGLVLMTLNIIGVSGFLSGAYERQQLGARATAHAAESIAHASAGLVERQLAGAEQNLAQARTMLIKARDDRGRVKAAQAIVTTATVERDALVRQLAAAQASAAKGESDTINAGSEFAAIAFIAAATGSNQDTVAHAVILVISSIPDLLAVLLLVAAGYSKPAAPAKKPARRRVVRRKRFGLNPALKVVPRVQAA